MILFSAEKLETEGYISALTAIFKALSLQVITSFAVGEFGKPA